ncbi:MAG: hypothetical protein OJF47_003303 [Nitrospira sp.]|jgi:Fe-S-cluster containining protein|nr:MAG: hypothetical protein OJF47_003303 [Nitrospira sp.]
MGPPTSSSTSLPLFQQAEQWFQRAQAALLGAIPCHRGCCRCCIGIFPITRLDALELQRGLVALPKIDRDAIITRAHAQVSALEAVYPTLKTVPAVDGWDDCTIDAVAERFANLPCPALAPDGSCEVYTFRPLTCRTMGIPGESNGVVQGACAVQTAVPVIRLSPSLRVDEDRLAEVEAVSLTILRGVQANAGDELLLPYGFLTNRDSTP